jgi:phosphate-selective porin OprO/OprP
MLALVAALPHAALAQTSTSDSSEDARINAIEQQIQVLQEELSRVKADLSTKDEQLRQSQEQTKQVQEQVKAVENRKPLVTFPGGRPTITSEDGKYSLAIGAQVQFDTGGYIQNSSDVPDLNNGENLRRGRLYFVAKMGDFTMNFTPDFGDSPDGVASLYEANLNYTGFKPVTATIGYFKPWLTLQDSMSSNDFLFLERPSIVEITRNVAAGDARAAVGAKASGDDYFAALYLTGAQWGSQNPNLLNDQQTGGTLRVATRPFRGEDWNTHIGISASKVFHLNEDDAAAGSNQAIRLRDRPELRIDQNRLIDTGSIPANGADTYGIELAANWQNFMVQAEYMRIDVDQDQPTGPSPTLTFQGGYIEGSWVITGESRVYNTAAAAYARPSPAEPFNLESGGWGAWELAMRYSVADLNSHENNGQSQASTGGVFGGLQQVYSVALSWYPIDQVRFQLQFSYVDVDRRDTTGTVQIGQNFEEIALRTQIAF